jgi:hypothetical protein
MWEWWQIQELIITLAVIVGVLVPVFALTLRLLTKPAGRDRERLRREAAEGKLRDQRLDHMERQLEDLEGLVRRLVEATEFDRQLQAGQPSDEEA